MNAIVSQSSSRSAPSGEVREIRLTRGFVAVVDAIDFVRLSQFKWRAVKSGQARTWYAVTGKNGVPMHHMVLTPPPGGVIDHKDRDGLNNTRTNLRQATLTQNAQNRSYRRNRPGCRGAYPHRKRWKAMIMVDRKQLSLGCFATEFQAARAYDIAAAAHFGEFAVLNFSPDRDWIFPHEHAGKWPPAPAD